MGKAHGSDNIFLLTALKGLNRTMGNTSHSPQSLVH
jgi:hypothetical protein